VSDFYRDATRPHARKQYVCVACGWIIPKGEQHMHQTGVYEGAYFSNRFHDECWDCLSDGGLFDDGFIVGDVPVPERFKADAEAHRLLKEDERWTAYYAAESARRLAAAQLEQRT